MDVHWQPNKGQSDSWGGGGGGGGGGFITYVKFNYIKTSQKRFQNLQFLLNNKVKQSDIVTDFENSW